MATRTLDPKRYVLTISGVKIVQPAKDTFYELSFEADQITDEVGGQGDVVRVISRDMRANLKITLMPSSPSNDYLSSLLRRDLTAFTPGVTTGFAVGSMSLVDLNGTTACDGEESWIVKYPDVKFGNTIYNREWALRIASATINVGGNVL